MSDQIKGEIDTGTAYGMKPATYNKNLVEVGPGTPMGELMRRYWQPFALSEGVTSDKPQKVRLLGEDLVVFRDKSGRLGLVHEHCCHRGTSLYYGRIEDDGIRCCYHGWKFDVQGHCLEQPAEVDKGRNRSKIRQPWYPVQERYGLVYAYMGPPEKKPVLPRWKHFEDLGPDEYVEAALLPVGPMDGYLNAQPFNWLQGFENVMDAPHVPWLHYHHSCDQFLGVAVMRTEDTDVPQQLPPYAHYKDLVGSMVVERTDLGVRQSALFPGMTRILDWNEAMVPNVAIVGTLIDMLYFVPMDDVNVLTFALLRSKKGRPRGDFREMHEGGKTWWDLTEEEHRASPGDFEAQSSIGRLPAHNREHLSQGDQALGALRRRLEEAVRTVQEGGDPPGVSFDEDAPPLRPTAHRAMHEEEAA